MLGRTTWSTACAEEGKRVSDIEDEDDLVAIKKTTDVKNGDLVVVRLEDEVTLKYFKKTNHSLELIPANKDFSTIEVDLREQEAFVEGKSVGLIRTH